MSLGIFPSRPASLCNLLPNLHCPFPQLCHTVHQRSPAVCNLPGNDSCLTGVLLGFLFLFKFLLGPLLDPLLLLDLCLYLSLVVSCLQSFENSHGLYTPSRPVAPVLSSLGVCLATFAPPLSRGLGIRPFVNLFVTAANLIVLPFTF